MCPLLMQYHQFHLRRGEILIHLIRHIERSHYRGIFKRQTYCQGLDRKMVVREHDR
jgi:hypothetical protein